MNRRRYEQHRELADRLALVCIGGRHLSRYLKKAPRKAASDLKWIKTWWSPNIAGFGIGPKESGDKRGRRLAIRFYVYRKLHESRVRKREIIPSKISLDHLEMELLTDVQQLEAEPVFHAPLPAGTQVGHFTGTAGTVGCYVRKTGTLTPLLLSCAHVLAPFSRHPNGGNQIESPVDNNSQAADNPVGLLFEHVGLVPGGTFPTDAALATLLPGNDPSNDALGVGRLSSMLLAPRHLAGVQVRMRGAATAQQVNGRISSDVLVTLPFRLEGKSYQVQNLLRYEIPARQGDSGATVVEAGTERVLGIHVGAEQGTTHAFFAPTWVVADRFQIDLLP